KKDNIEGHGDDKLTTVNNANHAIFSILTFNFPDTSLQQNGSCIGCFSEIEAKTAHKHLNSIDWADDIKRKNIQNTLTIFIVHADTFRTYSFEELQDNYQILK